MAPVHTSFNVPNNGFKFVNSFVLPFPTTIQLPLMKEIDVKTIIYGLCGGMSFAALDYYNANHPVPPYTDGNALPPSYLSYLWQRQLASLGLVVIPRVIDWMLHPDPVLAVRMARYEMPKLRRQLDQGKPAVLGLIRTQGVSDPSVNHQVLAIGYDADDSTRDLTLFLCDPNYVGIETTIHMNLAAPSKGLNITQSTGEVNRGIFVINYTKGQPPV